MENGNSNRRIRGLKAISEVVGYSQRETERLALSGQLPGVVKGEDGVWEFENPLARHDTWVVPDEATIYRLPPDCIGVNLEPVPGPVSGKIFIRPAGGGSRHVELTSMVSGSVARHHFLFEGGETTTRYIIDPYDYPL